MELLNQVAEELDRAYRTGPRPPVRGRLPPDLDAAYAVQELNTRRWLAEGRRLVGRKIGLTSLAVQRQLGVDQPDFGMLFADMEVPDGGAVPAGLLLQPKIEAELALVVERPMRSERHGIPDVVRATAWAAAALEIVDSRIANWDIRLIDTVADNASSGRFVLGTARVRLADIDPVGCTMAMRRGDEVVSAGSGAACLGNPLAAAAWLADTMVRYGRPLDAGDIVLTGALGPMVSVRPGDAFTAAIDGLGSVAVSFEA